MASEARDSADKWKFAILTSSFSMHIIVSAVNKSFGVLIPDMVVLFDTNVATIGFLCSLPVAAMLMSCPIVAHILRSDRVSPRVVAVVGALLSSLSLILSGYTRSLVLLGTFLVALGSGLSMAYMTQLVALNDFFPKGFIVMNSLTEIGSTLGVVLIPLIIERCKEAYGYNGAMMILGGVVLHLVVTGATIRPPRLDQREKSRINNLEDYYEEGEGTSSQERQSNSGSCTPEGDTIPTSNQQRVCEIDSAEDDHVDSVTSSDTYPLINKQGTKAATEDTGQELGEAEANESKDCQRKCHPVVRWLLDNIFIRHPLFTLIIPAHMLAQYGLYSWRLFLVPHAEWRGLASSDAVLMSTVGGLGALIGRILLVIALHFGFDPFLLFSISATVNAATFLVDPWVISFRVMLVTAFLQGWMLYINSAMWAALCKLTTSPASFKLACGYAALFGGIGGNAGGFLSGTIYDATQSFTKVFMCLGAVHIIIVIDLLVYMAIVWIKRIRQP